jgi:membrane protease subunit HflK
MPWDNQSGGPNGGNNNPWGNSPRPQGPDIDAWLNQLQENIKKYIPGGGGSGLILLLVGLLVLWGLSGFYRVQADEQGVVLRFGKFQAQTSPGLNYHIVNRVDIGMRGPSDSFVGGRVASRDVPEESLMLTGDENIVDVDFSVFWLINSASDFLFNIQNPEGTVKSVAESTMREIVGQNNIQPILTEQRQNTEDMVRDLMQSILDDYGAGITITQVKMQKVDPPAAVIDAFRDVQAARADQERARNEAQSYANRVVPEAQGEAFRIRREAEAYREQAVAEAEGQASRFAAVYNEYKQASDVTRQRIFLETVEKVMQRSNKIIIDQSDTGGGVIPYLPLDRLNSKTNKGDQ